MCERIITYHTPLETGSLLVYTIISLKQPQFFLALVKNSLSLTFLSEVLSLIRPDFSLLSLYYWSVLPTYSAYKSSWTTQHQLMYSNFSETSQAILFSKDVPYCMYCTCKDLHLLLLNQITIRGPSLYNPGHYIEKVKGPFYNFMPPISHGAAATSLLSVTLLRLKKVKNCLLW